MASVSIFFSSDVAIVVRGTLVPPSRVCFALHSARRDPRRARRRNRTPKQERHRTHSTARHDRDPDRPCCGGVPRRGVVVDTAYHGRLPGAVPMIGLPSGTKLWLAAGVTEMHRRMGCTRCGKHGHIPIVRVRTRGARRRGRMRPGRLGWWYRWKCRPNCLAARAFPVRSLLCSRRRYTRCHWPPCRH